MKKFIKKTIAGLIAGVMAVSSMPFTALAAQAADSTEKAYVKANISSFNDNGYTGTSSVSFVSGNAPSANILYANNTFQGTSSYVDHDVYNSDGPKYKFHGVQDVVLLNTNSDAYFPVSFEEADQGHSGTANRTYDYITPNTDSFETREDWVESSNWNSYDTKSGGITASGDPTYNNTAQPTYGIANRYFVNKIYLSSSNNNTSTYYDKYDSISFKIRLDWYYSYWSFGTKSDTIWDKEKTDVKYEQNKTVYVVNYKPIANAIRTMKSVYNTIQATGEDKYCSDYLENFYRAAYKVMTLNPNNYSYSSGVEAAVQEAGAAIKDVVNNYLTTATTEPTKHTEVTVDGKEATCTETGLTAGKKCSHCGVTLVAQTTIPATGHKYVYTKTDSADTHNVTCEKGDYTGTEPHDFNESGLCKKCGYQKSMLDLDAWNKAAQESGTILVSGASVYTAESFNEYNELYKSAVEARQNATTQEDVDKATAMLLSAKTVLRKKSVTVTLVYVNDSDEVAKTPETVAYGETYNAVSDKNVEKWTVSTDNGATTTRLNTYDKTVSIVVTKDVVIKAYQTNEEQTEDSSKVTFYGKNNVVVAVKYVAKGTELPTNTVGVPEIPFYNKGKWNKETVTGTGSDISVKAVYETTQAEDKLCGVHYDGFEGGVKKYSYDSYVYLTGADTTKKYALYSDAEHTKLLTILNGIDFYAPKTNDIYVGVYEGKDEASIGITGSFNQRDNEKGTKSAVYNCKFYLPKDATVVEYGLEVTLNGKTARVKAESKSERNEYSISLNAPITATSITAVDGRAYVTYTLNGKTTTIYSETVNQAL